LDEDAHGKVLILVRRPMLGSHQLAGLKAASAYVVHHTGKVEVPGRSLPSKEGRMRSGIGPRRKRREKNLAEYFFGVKRIVVASFPPLNNNALRQPDLVNDP
jgi:hypothetical protein